MLTGYLGAFFNGVFLIALALSILFQSIERFITVEEIDQPLLVIIIGGVGLVLNILSAGVAHGEFYYLSPFVNAHHAQDMYTIMGMDMDTTMRQLKLKVSPAIQRAVMVHP